MLYILLRRKCLLLFINAFIIYDWPNNLGLANQHIQSNTQYNKAVCLLISSICFFLSMMMSNNILIKIREIIKYVMCYLSKFQAALAMSWLYMVVLHNLYLSFNTFIKLSFFNNVFENIYMYILYLQVSKLKTYI